MLLKAVLLLLCVIVGTHPTATHKNKQWHDVELAEEDFDDAEGELGQSPWLELAQHNQALPPDAFTLDNDDYDEHNTMSPEAAAAILEKVTAAAAGHARLEAGLQEPSSIGFFTGTADLGGGFLDTASDAAAMQFMAVNSPADNILQESFGSAPPFQQVLSPAPASATERAPAPGETATAQVPPPAPPAPSPAAAMEAAAPGFGDRTPPPAPPMVQAPSPAPAPAPAQSASEAQLPSLALDGLDTPNLAPPYAFPADASARPPAPAAPQQPHTQDAPAQEQEREGQPQQQQDGQHAAAHGAAEEVEEKVALMGRGVWHAKGKVSFPTDPQIPPAYGNIARAGFCDPELGLEPTDDGRCICRQGYGTNADMRTCARCPVGWYSRGGQVGIAFCKPCPQLSTSNPTRTACVVRRNVIHPDVPKSLCEFCPIPTKPFDPPVCCGKGQVCCGKEGCCASRRCFSNATTDFERTCCGEDCNIATRPLKCCPSGEVCVNGTGNIQSCCGAAKICGDGLQQKSCCNALQSCCGGRECCNTGIGANPVQFCTDNSFTGPPANQLRCCLPNFVNCNGTCCQTRNNPATQVCLLDTRGLATCCNTQSLCTSPSDGSQQCCTSQQTCTRNITTTGQQIAACCTPGQSLCPKNAFQPICCAAGKCPSPSTAETCLQ